MSLCRSSISAITIRTPEMARKRRLVHSRMPLIIARNEGRCSYRLRACLADRGLTLAWKVPPQLGGDPGDVGNYQLACRACGRKLPTIIRTNQRAA